MHIYSLSILRSVLILGPLFGGRAVGSSGCNSCRPLLLTKKPHQCHQVTDDTALVHCAQSSNRPSFKFISSGVVYRQVPQNYGLDALKPKTGTPPRDVHFRPCNSAPKCPKLSPGILYQRTDGFDHQHGPHGHHQEAQPLPSVSRPG